MVFELGAVFKTAQLNVKCETIYGKIASMAMLKAAQACVKLHDEWCERAMVAIECWIGVARQLGVVKDLRLLIARMLWKERALWGKHSTLTQNAVGRCGKSN